MDLLLLCDENGNELGTAEFMDVHKAPGTLHKAFSIFLFSPDGTELLIQKRSPEKLLFRNLWTNTCCSHPREGEELVAAGKKRLQEELGFSCDIEPVSSFVYQANDPEGHGSEHEFDTIMIGTLSKDAEINPNPDEVSEVRWISMDDLEKELEEKPEMFSPWFPIALSKLK